MANSRPLEGIKVVELATFIAAPCCTRYLADLGADVIKIESPRGDNLRFTAVNEGRPSGDMEDTSFTLENTGKRTITLNIKTPAGREALEKLIAQADVFVTNNRLKALERSGLDYATLHAKYPSLVMGFVSGYGEKGPDKDLPGFDFTAYFARGGIIGTMYNAGSTPMTPIAGFGDHQVGMNLASGILAALLRAKTTGIGDEVIVSLFHSAVWDVSLYLSCSQYGDPATQYPVKREDLANQLQLTYKTSDGRWMQFAMPSYDLMYPKFVSEVLHREDLVNNELYYPQTNLQAHKAEFHELLTKEIAAHDAAYWADAMTRADLPFALCQTWDELLKDEQAWASDILTSVKFRNGVERTMVRTPVIFADTELPAYEPSHYMGEDTVAVLAELGYSESEIQSMIDNGEAFDVKRIS